MIPPRRVERRRSPVVLPSEAVGETEWQSQVIDLFTTCGWNWFHVHNSRRSKKGYPDLTLWHPKRGIIWLEVKTRTGRVTPEQERTIAELNEAAGRDVAWIARPGDWSWLVGLAGTGHRYSPKGTA